MDFNKQLRFGLRKSRIYGTLCSAVLGAFIMAGPIVHADEAQPSNTTTEAVSTDTSKTATLATEVVTDHASQTAILATENTRVADTTVANTTTENTETSPYVSDKAIAAAKEAFDNIDTSKALTAEDIKVPETLTTEQEGITETFKERYDDLPAPVRSVTKKVIINDENNGSLGATYSVSGIVTVNAHYFHESNPQQAVETLYHEVGHTIDGATYKKTALTKKQHQVNTLFLVMKPFNHFLKQPTQVMLTTKPSPHSLAPTCFKKPVKKKLRQRLMLKLKNTLMSS